MSLYLTGAAAPDGTFSQIKQVHVVFLSEHRFVLPLPVHDVHLILRHEEVVPGLNDVRC